MPGNKVTPPLDRFYRLTRPDGDCLMWTGFVTKGPKGGQPKFNPGPWPDGRKRSVIAHRWLYLELVGPIPDGYEIDHVKAWGCKGRPCVEITHLEVVTPEENSRRTRLDVCRSGLHDLTDPANVRWSPDGRVRLGCRLCHLDRKSERNAEIYADRGGRRWRADVCRSGRHDLTIEENILWRSNGKRGGCRPCQLEKKRASGLVRYYANLEAIREKNREYHRRKKLQREQG